MSFVRIPASAKRHGRRGSSLFIKPTKTKADFRAKKQAQLVHAQAYARACARWEADNA